MNRTSKFSSHRIVEDLPVGEGSLRRVEARVVRVAGLASAVPSFCAVLLRWKWIFRSSQHHFRVPRQWGASPLAALVYGVGQRKGPMLWRTGRCRASNMERSFGEWHTWKIRHAKSPSYVTYAHIPAATTVAFCKTIPLTFWFRRIYKPMLYREAALYYWVSFSKVELLREEQTTAWQKPMESMIPNMKKEFLGFKRVIRISWSQFDWRMASFTYFHSFPILVMSKESL